jgi:hypothetical protein
MAVGAGWGGGGATRLLGPPQTICNRNNSYDLLVNYIQTELLLFGIRYGNYPVLIYFG